MEHLLTDLQKLKADREKEAVAVEAEAATLKRRGEEAEARVAELEKKLNGQSDYELIKRDLAIMRSVEFPGEDEKQQQQGQQGDIS